MNIDSVTSVSPLQSTKSVASDSVATAENGSDKDAFASTLSDQKSLLQEAKRQTESSEQLQKNDNPSEDDELSKNVTDTSELVALLEKYLPPATEASNPVDNTASLLTGGDLVNGGTANPAADTANLDLGSALASSGLAFAKPAPADIKLRPSGDNLPPADFLQSIAGRSESDPESLNKAGLLSVDGLEAGKETLVSEKQSFLSSLEKALPSVTADMLPAQKLADGKTELSAIARPVSHPNWGQDLGEQIMWMNNKSLSAAEIRLNPEHLGPISVRIDVNQDQQASILFTAQHLDVKDAIEASIPKLREMMVNQQIDLVNVNISQHSTPDQGRSPSTPMGTMANEPDQAGDENIGMENGQLSQVVVGNRLLNLYV